LVTLTLDEVLVSLTEEELELVFVSLTLDEVLVTEID